MEKFRDQLRKALSPPKTQQSNNMEMAELISTIEKLLLQNKRLYVDLLEHDPLFNYQLYRPKNELGLSIDIQK